MINILAIASNHYTSPLLNRDCGYIDDEDLVYVKGRMAASERFKVMGDVVYPGGIESVLCKHPKIRQAMVIHHS